MIVTKNLRFLDIIKYKDLDIKKGEFCFLVGESGCGKSTYLKMLNASVLPSEGEIFFEGKNILDLDVLEYRKKVLLATQDVFLFDLSIKENFKLFYEYREEKLISEEKMKEYLSVCKANFELDKNCTELSGGERQRVFLATCLSFLPKVLLLDEPTSALDSKTARVLLESLKNFCKSNSITALIICHSDELSDEFADRIIKFDRRDKQ